MASSAARPSHTAAGDAAPPDDDPRLVEALQGGDEAAFQVLREQACQDETAAGGRRLVELNRAHRWLSEGGRADASGGGR